MLRHNQKAGIEIPTVVHVVPGTMPCAVCGGPAMLMRHQFRIGDLRNPKWGWDVVAPLHYVSCDNFRGMEVGFCGVGCGLRWRTEHGRD